MPKDPYCLEALVFTANWCDPCFDSIPLMNRILAQSGVFKKVHTIHDHKDPDICQFYGILGFPTIVFRVVHSTRTWEIPYSRMIGICNQRTLEEQINKCLQYKNDLQNGNILA